MTQTEIEMPAYIARETGYTGRYLVTRKAPKAASFAAREIAAMTSTGIIWKSFGHPSPGKEGFGRERYVAAPNGDLHIYAADGHRVIIYPADRMIRVLTA